MNDSENASRKLGNVAVFAIFSLFLIAGLLVSGFSIYGAAQCGKANLTWKSARATILESEVVVQAHSSTHKSPNYLPAVRYRFVYEGIERFSTSVGVAAAGMSVSSPFREIAKAWVVQHPIGSRATVRVDPADPSRSALETSVPFGVTLSFFIGIPFVLVGAIPVLSSLPISTDRFLKGSSKLLFVWGLGGLVLHLMAGPLSLTAKLLFGGYFLLFVIGFVNRRSKRPEKLSTLRPPPKGTTINARRADVEDTDPDVRETLG